MKENEEEKTLNELENFLSDEPVKVKEQKIIIDGEISSRLWKLEPDEYENLKQALIKEGCREPLIIWNNILIDGHNRYEICKAFDVEFRTIEKHFNNKNEALKWIDTNQLSRRNLLDWQRTILYGRISNTYKLPEGNSQLRQNVVVKNQQDIADELGVSTRTLQRAEKYTKAYDKVVDELGKDKADELAKKTTRNDLIEISKEPEIKVDVVNKIIDNPKLKRTGAIKEIKKDKQASDGSKIKLTHELIDIRLGDFTKVLNDIPDNSIDIILTDPPYPYEYINCWTELGEFAEKKLKEGGFLIAYSGHMYLPEVINRVMSSGLKWYWLGSCLHTGKGGLAQCFEVNMWAKHKPILFLYKGKKVKQSNWCEDVFNSNSDNDVKDFHIWGQTPDIFDKMIKVFEPKIVVDPFLGGGTTAIACLTNNVKFIGAEIDEQSYNISKKRIQDYDEIRTNVTDSQK